MEVWKTKTLIHNLRKHFADEFVARVTSFKSCLIQCDFHCINYVLLCVTDSLQAFQCVPQFNSEILTHLSHARFNMSRLWRQNCTAIYGIILLSKDMTSVLFWGFLYIYIYIFLIVFSQLQYMRLFSCSSHKSTQFHNKKPRVLHVWFRHEINQNIGPTHAFATTKKADVVNSPQHQLHMPSSLFFISLLGIYNLWLYCGLFGQETEWTIKCFIQAEEWS